jgi:probable DNA repair protein
VLPAIHHLHHFHHPHHCARSTPAFAIFRRVQLNSLLEQGVVALTASRRLAHALRLRYAQFAQAQGWTVWRTPQAMPWAAWVHQQYLAHRATREGKSDRVLTRAQARVVWDEIVAHSRVGRELLAPANAAHLAARSWQRLHEYSIPLERLREFDTPEAVALFGWCTEFERRCASLGAIDEVRLVGWLEASALIPHDRIALVGFDTLTPPMSRLIDRWRAADRIADVEEEGQQAAIEVIGCADAAAEIEAAAHWARAHIESGTSSVGVIVGDLPSRRTEAQRVFEDVFAPGQRRTNASASAVPVVVAAPAPLSEYPIVDAALLVLKLAVGDSDSTIAGRLLRSPFIVGGEAERGQRALADMRLREEQRERWNWFELERWAALTHCEQLSLAARELTTMLRPGWSSAAPSEWAERYQAMLLRIGWPGERTPTSVEHQTRMKFREALAEFGALDAVAPRLTARQALHRFQELLRETPFEPETTTASVIVIDAMTSAGMQFDALWVVGLQADRMPAPASPDALIPLELQREAGIPEATPAGLLRTAHMQLSRWGHSARHVVFSWPERDGDAELSPSPLLASLPLGDAIKKQTLSLREAMFAHRPPLEFVDDMRAPAVRVSATTGGAAILELQSRCPFKAQAQLRLKAKPLERVGIGVQPPDRGGILHEVLHELWGALGTQSALLELSEAALEARVRELAQRHALAMLRPQSRVAERLTALEAESATRQVLALLAIERARPPFRVRFAESSERYTIGGLEVTLRPDRIDELAGGGELLIDYKLGAAHKPVHWLDRTPGRPLSPQLPLYGLAHGEQLRALAFVVLAAGKVEYRGWSDALDVAPGVDPYPPRRLRVDLGDPMDWQALQDQWRFTLTQLAERFVAGEALVDPLPLECERCHLSTLCRIHEAEVAEHAERDDE